MMRTGISYSSIKRMLLILILFQFISGDEKCLAQAGIWTWMHGDTTLPNNYSIVGPAGQFGTSYRPIVYYEQNSWKDKQGIFWYMTHSDSLWKFDPSINQWAFIRGSGYTANFGVKGVPDPLNTPGNRQTSAITWVDTSGNLWLFGAWMSNGLGADLWKFDVTTLLWTWISGTSVGTSLGNFGVQGIPSVNNFPSSRTETNAGWVDSSSNTLWLYGGQTTTNNGSYDLWKYEIATNEWTWMTGDTISYKNPVFGTKGIPNPLNTP